MNRFMVHVVLGRWEYRKEFDQEVSEEVLGLDRGRVLNFILEECIMNVDFGFNCPWQGPVTDFPEHCNEVTCGITTPFLLMYKVLTMVVLKLKVC